MISELNDEEILELLMTSEFDGDFSPKELKYLLLKYRYFYRMLHGRLERVKTDNEGAIENLNDKINSLNITVTNLQVENANKENTIHGLENRKLTWKERWTGKIITNKDEN
jgi:hypothetical protein